MQRTASCDITGLVLAGGRGSRMGGVDKGLQSFGPATLAAHALQRLRPQVGALMVSANRHLDDYATLGVAVVMDDEVNDFAGPLAGLLSGLRRATTPWLISVPCDAPFFPVDLVARLSNGADAVASRAAVAVAVDGLQRHRQPVFCLLRTSLADSLAAYLAEHGRKVGHWLMQQGCVDVEFDIAAADPHAFDNINTLDELMAATRRL